MDEMEDSWMREPSGRSTEHMPVKLLQLQPRYSTFCPGTGENFAELVDSSVTPALLPARKVSFQFA